MNIRRIKQLLFSISKENQWLLFLYFLCTRIALKEKKPSGTQKSPWDRYRKSAIKWNRIVFRSILKGYSCNSKYICEEIIRQGLPFELIWVVEPEGLSYMGEVPPEVKLVMAGTDDAFEALSTCRVSVDTVHRNIDRSYEKKKGQYRIITWHGQPVKKISNHEHGRTCLSVIGQWRKDKPDYLIADSEREGRILRRVFANEGKLCVYGYPRNDILVTKNCDDLRKKILVNLGISPEKKILLYAPTWRDDKNVNWLTINYKSTLEACQERWGGDWVLAVRMHHMMYNEREKFETNNVQAYNLTDYPDMQELLLVSDVLITDYSSCFIDFMHTHKPSFLYVPDEKEYNYVRGLYYPMDSTHFPVARDNDMLRAHILRFNQQTHMNSIMRYLSEISCKADGHASERVVDILKGIILGETSKKEGTLK